jgi:hypothetical protein
MCVCAAVLFSRELPFTSLIWTMIGGCGFGEPEQFEGVVSMGYREGKVVR